jgi:hypothetical protein
MQGLMLHRGAVPVKREELDLIPMPEETDSYVPISHYHLAEKLLTISQDILTDYVLVGENYGIARQGQQMFAVLNFKNDNKEMALSIAFRNSYDRSMSLGFAFGGSVFCCDNLSLQGEVVVMRKHTKNVWTGLEDTAIATLYKSQHNFQQICADAESLRGKVIDNRDAFSAMGILYGNDIVSPRQLTVLKEEWLKPKHEEFQPRNLWSLYNCGTESLKSSPPISIMEKHINMHDCFKTLSEGQI